MPEAAVKARARKAKRQGKSPSTQAGEFVREEIHHIREGKHGARSAKQAIAIGLSKARRAGVPLKTPSRGVSADTRKKAKADRRVARRRRGPSQKRSRAMLRKLRREGREAGSPRALARQASASARKRGARARSAAARKAARTRAKRRR